MTDFRGGPGAALERRRLLARAALLWEAVWPRVWPALGLLGCFLAAALLGLPPLLPGAWHMLLLAGVAGGLGFLLWRGFRGFRAPDDAAAERRMERFSGLRHRPLAALADRPATGDDPTALAFWKAHQARAAAQIARLRVGAPRPGLPARDPMALRGALAVGLVAALTVAGGEAPERLRRALLPELDRPAPAPAQRLEAWVTPPAYTGAAPIFLSPSGGAATVPKGSRLQVSVSGGSGAPPLLATDAGDVPFRALEGASFLAETPLGIGSRLSVVREGRTVAEWNLAVQADAPPTAAFAEPPGRAQRGLAVRLPWRAEDDWGLSSLRAEARLKARPDAPPLVLELSLPGGRENKQARGTAQPDLSAHPWAGLEVEFRLVARDGADQEGRSEDAALALPERAFNHRVARQVIAVRKALSLAPDNRRAPRSDLEAIAAAPDAFEHDVATYLALRVARSRLLADRRPEAVAEVQDLLWEVALALEEGRDGRTLRALQQAREALRQALDEADRREREAQERAAEERREAEEREARREEGQPRDEAARQREEAEQRQREEARRERNEEQDQQRAELQRRIQELREAIRQHLEALAEKLQRENAEAMPPDPQNRLMDQRELNRRTERMEEAAREGRTEDAKRELAELEEMLRALEEGRTARQESPERQGQRQRGQQQMGVVQDMVRRQGEMLDRSHQRADAEEGRRAQERRQQQLRNQGLRWPLEPPPPSPPRDGAAAEADPQAREQGAQDGRRQRALRRALGELMQQFGDLTGEVPEALGRADQAMRDAQEALREGGDARDPQARAMRALQEGGRQMAQAMQRQFGSQPQEGEGEGEGDDMAGDPQNGGEGQDRAQAQGEGRDPLGRRRQETGGTNEEGADTRVPDEAELLRTRRIQEELRRRGAEKARPADELDYIDRLLRRF